MENNAIARISNSTQLAPAVVPFSHTAGLAQNVRQITNSAYFSATADQACAAQPDRQYPRPDALSLPADNPSASVTAVHFTPLPLPALAGTPLSLPDAALALASAGIASPVPADGASAPLVFARQMFSLAVRLLADRANPITAAFRADLELIQHRFRGLADGCVSQPFSDQNPLALSALNRDLALAQAIRSSESTLDNLRSLTTRLESIEQGRHEGIGTDERELAGRLRSFIRSRQTSLHLALRTTGIPRLQQAVSQMIMQRLFAAQPASAPGVTGEGYTTARLSADISRLLSGDAVRQLHALKLTWDSARQKTTASGAKKLTPLRWLALLETSREARAALVRALGEHLPGYRIVSTLAATPHDQSLLPALLECFTFCTALDSDARRHLQEVLADGQLYRAAQRCLQLVNDPEFFSRLNFSLTALNLQLEQKMKKQRNWVNLREALANFTADSQFQMLYGDKLKAQQDAERNAQQQADYRFYQQQRELKGQAWTDQREDRLDSIGREQEWLNEEVEIVCQVESTRKQRIVTLKEVNGVNSHITRDETRINKAPSFVVRVRRKDLIEARKTGDYAVRNLLFRTMGAIKGGETAHKTTPFAQAPVKQGHALRKVIVTDEDRQVRIAGYREKSDEQDAERTRQQQADYRLYQQQRELKGQAWTEQREDRLDSMRREQEWLNEEVEIVCQVESTRKQRIVTLKEIDGVNSHITRDETRINKAPSFVVRVRRKDLIEARKTGDYAVRNLLFRTMGAIKDGETAHKTAPYAQAPVKQGHMLRKLIVTDEDRQVRIAGYREKSDDLPLRIAVFDVRQELQRQWEHYALNPVLLPDGANSDAGPAFGLGTSKCSSPPQAGPSHSASPLTSATGPDYDSSDSADDPISYQPCLRVSEIFAGKNLSAPPLPDNLRPMSPVENQLLTQLHQLQDNAAGTDTVSHRQQNQAAALSHIEQCVASLGQQRRLDQLPLPLQNAFTSLFSQLDPPAEATENTDASAGGTVTLAQLSQAICYANNINTVHSVSQPDLSQIIATWQDVSIYMVKRHGSPPLLPKAKEIRATEPATSISGDDPQQSDGLSLTDHCRIWQNMIQAQRDNFGGAQGYGRTHNIDARFWQQLAQNDRLRDEGEALVAASSVNKKADYIFHLNNWKTMGQDLREMWGGPLGYAEANKITVSTWERMVGRRGLQQSGVDRLAPAPAETRRIGYYDHLDNWDRMSAKEKADAGGSRKYAYTHNLCLSTWKRLVNEEGLSNQGLKQLIGYAGDQHVNYGKYCKIWHEMQQQARQQAGGAAQYAVDNRLSVDCWLRLANDIGLTDEGNQRMAALNFPSGNDYGQHCIIWQQISRNGNLPAGSARLYADSRNLIHRYWSMYATDQGLTEKGHKKMMATLTTGGKIDYSLQCQLWITKSPEFRARVGGARGYAELNSLNSSYWSELATDSGLTEEGQRRLMPSDKSRKGYDIHLLGWLKLSDAERNADDAVRNYANKHVLNYRTFSFLANKNGLSNKGTKRLLSGIYANETRVLLSQQPDLSPTPVAAFPAAAITHQADNTVSAIPDSSSIPVTQPSSTMQDHQSFIAYHCQQWQKITEKTEAIREGAKNYALSKGINKHTWAKLANDSGLTADGNAILNKTHPGPLNYLPHLETWSNMTEELKKMGVKQYAVEHGLRYSYFSRLVDENGLKPRGAILWKRYCAKRPAKSLKLHNKSITNEPPHPQAVAPEITGAAIKTESSLITDQQRGKIWQITLDDRGMVLNREQLELPQQDTIRNDLPILRDPDDPSRSLTLQAEGKASASEINTTNWGELNSIFAGMPSKESKAAKMKLSEAFRQAVEHETTLEITAGDRMITAPTCHEVNGEIISLGNGVFNGSREIIPSLTLLAPYAGIYHASVKSLQHERRKQGADRTSAYLFGTNAITRTVSGLASGNITKNINTGQLGNNPAIASNNVAAVRFGKNLTMLVTTRDVMPGEEYFISYGDEYLKAQTEIKAEPAAASSELAPPTDITFSSADVALMADSMLRAPGAWHSELGEQAAVLLINSAQLPSDTVLTVNRDGVSHIYRQGQDERCVTGRYQPQPAELHVALRYSEPSGMGHYDIETAPGEIIPIAADGDCLYQAISRSLTESGFGQFDVRRLRGIAADEFLAHSPRYLQMVDAARLKIELEARKLPIKRRYLSYFRSS